MSDLDRRKAAFAAMTARFPGKRVTDLAAAYAMPEGASEALMRAAFVYLAACRGECGRMSPLEILVSVDREPPDCMTPNGMLVPKRNTVLEYNLVVRAFAHAINSLGIDNLIESWHVPLNVRVKTAAESALNMSRAHPTEHPHSDSWAGESAESVTVHIPLLGDWKRNRLQLFDPSDAFEESWLGPRASYRDGSDVLPHYTRVGYVAPLGSVLLMDFAELHASTRDSGCGSRLSIDTTFVLRRPIMRDTEHPWRKGERTSHQILNGIGETHLFYFPDAPGIHKDVGQGFKHSAHLEIVELPCRA